jgi:DNA-binding CsgD family transcriptional regulator
VLQSLGLTDFEEQVYRRLLRGQVGGLANLARELGVGRRRVETAVRRLADAGLVRSADGGAGPAAASNGVAATATVPTALDPEIAVRELLRRTEDALHTIAGRLPELSYEYRLGTFGGAPQHALEVVTGGDVVTRRIQALGAVATDLMLVDTPPYSEDADGEVERELPRLARGVTIRVIYDSTALASPQRLASIRTLVAHGEQARVLPHAPLKLAIFDRRVAVVPLVSTDAATHSVALVRESGLLDALITLFETLWASAPRLDAPPDAGPLSPDDAELVSLLASGVKDEAVARQLGISVRTARRRIAELMDRLGATSRFQAGVEAARRGWL